jgi:predicted transcriptional regulator
MAKIEPEPTLTGAQLRAARALLNMSAHGLATRSKVSLRTIRRAESDNGAVSMTAANTARLIEVLEERGVVFGADCSMVSLRQKPKPSFGD